MRQWIKWRKQYKLAPETAPIFYGEWEYFIFHDDPNEEDPMTIDEVIYTSFIIDNEPEYFGFEYELIDKPSDEFLKQEYKWVDERIQKLTNYKHFLEHTIDNTLPANICPKCRVSMLSFSSFQYRQCTQCGTKYAWTLKDGQLPLIQHQR